MVQKKKDSNNLIGNKVGLDLLDGTRLIGKVSKWDDCTVFLDIGIGDIVDVPRNIIQRMLVEIEGNKI